MQREADLLVVHPHSRRVVGAGYVDEPCGQRLRHPPDAPVVGEKDGDRHRPARGHRRLVEGPGGAGSLHRDGVYAADPVSSVSESLSIPEKECGTPPSWRR